VADPLHDVKLFSSLSAGHREILDRVMVDEELKHGHVLFREGDKAGGMVGLYVLRSGTLTVQVSRPEGGFATVTTIQAGEVVGLIGLVLPEAKRTGTLVATGAARVSHLSRPAFLSLYHSNAPLACAFQLAIARQLVLDLRRVDLALRAAVLDRVRGVPLGSIHIG
jgi:CRP-like cAMP-binding protein